jgi:hypothetical protein
MRFGSGWIGFEKSIQNPMQRFSQKEHPNTKKYSIFCSFQFFWFGLRFLFGLV